MISQSSHSTAALGVGAGLDEGPAATRRQQFIDQIELTPISPLHVQDLAGLHYEELHWSFNGHLGKNHILALYNAIAQSPHFFGYACYNGEELLGFVTATTNLTDTRSRILNVYQHKFLSVAAVLLKNPQFLVAALESKFAVPWLFKKMGAKGEWLTLVTRTSKSYIAPFVALRLAEAVRSHFLAEGMDFYVAQGYRINPKAMKMYAALKWEVAARMLMHKIYRFPTRRLDER